MVTFTNFIPLPEQIDVARTSIVNFTILYTGTVASNTLSVSIDDAYAITNGAFTNGYTGNIFSSTGQYVVGIYPKRPYFAKASEIPIHIEIVDGTLDSYNYSVYTVGYNPPAPVVAETFVTRACSGKPFFTPNDVGLTLAKDDGIGTEITLSWGIAHCYYSTNILRYNIYVGNSRDVFDGYPDFVVDGNSATIWGLAPGDLQFFGVRAAEFNTSYFTESGMSRAGNNMYFYPEIIYSDAYLSKTALSVSVTDTSGFSNYGIIQIDSELLRYTGVSSSSFTIAANGRGYGNTVAISHESGSRISLYYGEEDGNTVSAATEPTFQKPNYSFTYVEGDGYGNDGYRDGYDGYAFHDGYLIYRQEEFNDITSPGTQNDASGGFPRQDYCGSWRASSPQSFMQGQCVRSYFGGVRVVSDSNGERHLVKNSNVYTHMSQREETLLETTGEPMILLRRMWTGMRCHCFMLRREHPDMRCETCFGVGFISGYFQVFNPRRSDRRIMVRVSAATDDLEIVDRGGFETEYEPEAWTLAYPAIRDRDILVRFIDEDILEEWRYEVLDVTRNKVLFSQTGAQKMKLKRIVKTDIIYSFPVIRQLAPYPKTINTSTTTTSGMDPHYHQIVVAENVNLTNFKGATLEAQNHNHIIYNGVVYTVLNHTHTL